MPHTSNIQNLLKSGESQTVEFKTFFGREVIETGNSSDIQIKIFDDKITFFSPGTLYGSLTIERQIKSLTDEKLIEWRGSRKTGGYYLIEKKRGEIK